MKKILFIALFAFVSTFAYAGFGDVFTNAVDSVYSDTKDVVHTVYGDSKDLIKNAYPEVKAVVVSLASALGVAAEHVYTVIVKKFVVDGIKELLVFFGALCFLFLGIVGVNKYLNYSKPFNFRIFFPVAYLIVAFAMMCSVDFNNMLMGLINPEYGAINYIIECSKSLIQR